MSSSIIFRLYRLLTAAAVPLTLLYVGLRTARNRSYARGWTERFGFLPASYRRTTPEAIWLHAVSVGEVLSCVPLIAELRRRLPRSPIFVSCSTRAGREAADAKLGSVTDGLFFAPFDHVFAVRGVLRAIRPAVLVTLETEIWPNLWREAKRFGIGLAVANGRISDKTAEAYARKQWFFTHVLAHADAILVQSGTDRERYLATGAPADRVQVVGNLKYDFEPSSAVPAADLQRWLDAETGPLWIAASTVGPEFPGDVDEDDAVLEAYRILRIQHGNLRLLLAPRKPERFGVVADKLRASGLRFSRRRAVEEASPVLLLDSVGELAALFPSADVVFMGGTLAHRGGHNILEPAACGRPIIVGPHLENFAEIQRSFREGNGFLEIQTPLELAPAVNSLLGGSELGQRAARIATAERGATARVADIIERLRWTADPAVVKSGVAIRQFLAALWLLGGRVKRSQDLRRQCRLPAPVISIGGLSMGGTGKTPTVRWLARVLRERGFQPAVLTRGYGRADRSEATKIMRAGSGASVDVTGDEPQLLLRDGAAHVGIGADRCKAGHVLAAELRPDVFLLDDGFQHARVHRDVDIVLIDALDPWGGGGVFPLGRLREAPAALRRANIVVITRSEVRPTDTLEQQIRRHAPEALVVRSRTVPLRWVDAFSGTLVELGQPMRGVAFCGLGNPQSFWRTLEQLRCDVAAALTFADHHRYTPSDLRRVVDAAQTSSAQIVFTTEKDAVKLPQGAKALLGSLRLLVLYISLEFDRTDDLLGAILCALQRQSFRKSSPVIEH